MGYGKNLKPLPKASVLNARPRKVRIGLGLCVYNLNLQLGIRPKSKYPAVSSDQIPTAGRMPRAHRNLGSNT